ncbi:MAG: lipoate--protein ligase family protein [Deltaproteobacteria bacterium]|nr:lipoate--protein ligase family protein [Deltaproteobacteria bacterium]
MGEAGRLRPVTPLLDEDLIARVEAGASWAHRMWEASTVAVVLGRGTAASEVRADSCAADGVPVLRRRGGGGAVVLGPGCLIVSLAAAVERELEAGGYLDRIAAFLAGLLGRLTGLPLEPRGIGDVCLGDRKVLGASLFRRRRLLFYQASLLHSLNLALVDGYLTHPAREPAYRQGRPHRAFLTTLAAAGSGISVDELCEGLERRLPALAERLE